MYIVNLTSALASVCKYMCMADWQRVRGEREEIDVLREGDEFSRAARAAAGCGQVYDQIITYLGCFLVLALLVVLMSSQVGREGCWCLGFIYSLGPLLRCFDAIS